jgi:hypothetical protein
LLSVGYLDLNKRRLPPAIASLTTPPQHGRVAQALSSAEFRRIQLALFQSLETGSSHLFTGFLAHVSLSPPPPLPSPLFVGGIVKRLRPKSNFLSVWKEKYGGSTGRWIKESVVPNLKSWGFNTVGWVQEVTVKQWRHSRTFTNDEYQALRMTYCHLLP